ncbi:MAG: acetyl-CoA C-acyltransferase [Candidatus Eremiobacteraeota bacterium]|nr:acetyl-CoA C-acyltransferase [Candidatus Eremiobacteraeota bacterium]
MNSKAVVLGTARTPFGRLGGAISNVPATSLGAAALAGALERAGVDPSDVEHVIMGEVLQAGVGQAPARQAAFKAGLAKTTTAETVNKVCASGMLAVVGAASLINAGDNAVVAAGGMESMSLAPYLLKEARTGYRFGDGKLVDAMINDGLWDYYFEMTMATQGAKVARELGITREEQDRFAYESHKRAQRSHESGTFKDEILPLKVASKLKGKFVVEKRPAEARARIPALAQGNGSTSVWDHAPSEEFAPNPDAWSPFVTGDVPHALFEQDESVRGDADLAAMAKLKPIDKDGTITAANAPGVNDGAAALVLADEDWAKEHGHEPLGTIAGHATVGWDSPYIALTPAMAAQKLMEKYGLRKEAIHVWEINEAFSAVVLASTKRLGLDPAAVNLRGGAVAIGHPIGASGARIVASVIHQLRARGGGLGIAAICSGGGQGDAMLVRVG